MFCTKCGKEMMDEAIVCPNCGCGTNNFIAQKNVSTPMNAHSNDYVMIKQFSEKARALRNLGIFAAVFMFGIGIIFSIIIWAKQSNNKIPEIKTKNPVEIVEFEKAKRQYETAKKLAALPILAIGLCILIASISILPIWY